MIELPQLPSFEALAAFRAAHERWVPVALDIARAHRLPAGEASVFREGSNLIVGLGAVVLKIFPPLLRHQYESERACLARLHGQLGVAVPELLVDGERSGWPYLAMTRLPGVTGEHVWPELAEPERERLLHDVGALIAQVQNVPLGPLASLEPRWEDFWPRQLAACRAVHERQGLAPHFLAGLDALLADAVQLVPASPEPALLTGEYIPENFLLTQEGGSWRLSGLIDFGDAMTGFREYDLLGPSVFMGGGEPGRVRALLSGYGYGDDARTPALRRRLLALYLSHRFSVPARQLRIDRWAERAEDLDALGRLIWPW